MTAARAVKLSVSALSPVLTPRTAAPTTGHLTLRGWRDAEARASKVSVSVLSSSGDQTHGGHLTYQGHTPEITVTDYPVTVTLLGVEVLGQESSVFLSSQLVEPTSSAISIAERRWPRGLPGPLVDGYAVEMQDTSLRSAMDTGPGKVRRRFSAASSYVTANWRMDRTQLYAFHDWYVNTLQRGTLTFLWPDPWTKPYHVVVVDPTHNHNGSFPIPNVNGCCPQHPWVVMLAGDAGSAKAYELQYDWMTVRFRKLNPYKPVGGTMVLESNVPATPTLSYSSLALLWEVSAELEILP